MRAYRRLVVIKDPKRVVVKDVPFRPGERVEVLFLAPDDNRDVAASELKKLLKTTQALPQSQAVTDEEIAAEVAAYRSGL